MCGQGYWCVLLFLCFLNNFFFKILQLVSIYLIGRFTTLSKQLKLFYFPIINVNYRSFKWRRQSFWQPVIFESIWTVISFYRLIFSYACCDCMKNTSIVFDYLVLEKFYRTMSSGKVVFEEEDNSIIIMSDEDSLLSYWSSKQTQLLLLVT